jgi:hypothetical protein
VKLLLTQANFVLHANSVEGFWERRMGVRRKTYLETNEEGSMFKSKLRLLSVSAIVGAGLIASTSADAANVRIGGIDLQIDTTMSVGATFQLKDSDAKFLPEGNGGPAEVNGRYDFYRYDDGSVKYYNPNVLTTAGTPAMHSSDATVRATALMDTQLPDGAGGQLSKSLSGFLSGGKSKLGDPCDQASDFKYGGFCQTPVVPDGYNYDSSINTDDARLNFAKGDAVSAPVKLVSDISFRQGAVSGLLKVRAFYDAILMDDNNFGREGGLSDDGIDDAGANIEVLDAYLAYDFDVGNMPATIRIGNQVINWGEATFIPGGNSAFNPIDVPAIRRPGAEIKEALLPVEALYGSIALTDSVSVEAYVGGWDPYKLDVGGTFFASSDVFQDGTTTGNGRNYLIGGGPTSGTQWACDTAEMAAAGMNLSAALVGAVNTASGNPCDGSPKADLFETWTPGAMEAERVAVDSENLIESYAHIDGEDSMGLALRWYAENLNSTEFGFYYQKADSRLPYISYRTKNHGVGATMVGRHADQVGRGVGISGCASAINAGIDNYYAAKYDPASDLVAADVKLDTAFFAYRPATGDLPIADTDGVMAAYKATLEANAQASVGAIVYGALIANNNGLAIQLAETKLLGEIEKARAADADFTTTNPYKAYVVSKTANALSAADKLKQYGTDTSGDGTNDTQFVEFFDSATEAIAHHDALAAAAAGADTVDWGARRTDLITRITAAGNVADFENGAAGSIAEFQQVTCAGIFAQGNESGAVGTVSAGHPFDALGQLATGTVLPSYNYDMGLFAEYPEIETYGFSFNTVLAGWGVQGDFTYRPDAPLQLDTDVLTIASLFKSCAALGAGPIEAVYLGAENYNKEFRNGAPIACTPGEEYLRGYVEHDVVSWDIGTTATFTRSNPIVNAIGADIGILLTEFAGIVIDGAEDRAMPGAFGVSTGPTPLVNNCTSGSDVPLGSLLQIDDRPDGQCRTTDASSGMVLLARAQYNNVFGSPLGLAPTIVFREGLNGLGDGRLSTWKEGVGSTSFSLGVSYLDAINGSVNYTTYHGDDLFTKNKDREHVSVSVSYAF